MTEERCTPEKTGFAAEVEKKISEHAGFSSVEQLNSLSRESIRAAIGTEERRIWLDPEDIDAITDDVLALIRSSAP